ncbi:MAG: hypothetical protein AAGA62_14260 [Bacteroidota bacterium]
MRYLTILLFIGLILPLKAQESFFDHLHAKGDTVHLHFETEWKKLIRKKANKTSFPLRMGVQRQDSVLSLPGKIRSRGNIRLEVCNNPSLKIKLKKDGLRKAGFSDLNDFKLVLQCSNGKVGESYLRREALVYDLHRLYSGYTHRTIPVVIHFTDPKIDDINAFFIEHEEQLEARYNARILKSKIASTRGLKRAPYINMCLFNYLVLNTDWHVFNLHNIEIINPLGTKDLVPIPYDFDYSGFVGTSYAIPREELKISTVYSPKWLGKHVTEAEIKAGAAHFLSKSEEAEKLIQEHPTLTNSARKRMLKRLEDFHKVLQKEKDLLRLIR